MPSAEVNGTVLHYRATGTGMPCLVMHGWPGTDHTYLQPGLDPLGERLRLVYYDHRGHGRSDRAGVPGISMDQLADDAAALADHLGAERVVVLGHHHGASVAQHLAVRHPDRVAGLILVAASPGSFGSQESLADTLGDTPTPVEVEVLQRVPPASEDELDATMGALAPFMFHQPERHEPGPAAVFALAALHADAAGQLMRALDWWSSVDALAGVAVPALVLVGRHDVFCGPHESARILRHLPGARLVVLESSGHLPWLEEPGRFFAAVDDWLDALADG
ncbi:MAG TPA: alpha/beta hydrolase [Acidimicrobiales bacterium]|nr:alpha/beta hydrolase [Acidimicrobiales bacterium]